MPRGEVTDQVRELATMRGVSERTVWRWFQRMRQTERAELLEPRQCDYCATPLPAGSTLRRRFCDATCRQYAYRHRRERERRARHRAEHDGIHRRGGDADLGGLHRVPHD